MVAGLEEVDPIVGDEVDDAGARPLTAARLSGGSEQAKGQQQQAQEEDRVQGLHS